MTTDLQTLKSLAEIDSYPILQTIKIPDHEFDTRIIYSEISHGTILQIGESLEEKEEMMELLRVVFIAVVGLGIPIASAVGFVIARQATRGIEEVTRAVLDIENGEFDRRVSIYAKEDEIRKLVDTFNAMAERIRNLIGNMREMIDNIAHDLRSPLARIRAISEAALSRDVSADEHKAAAVDTLEECDQLIALINTTLDVAEAEAGLANSDKTEVNISKLAEEVCELFEPLAEQKNIQFSMRVEPECRVRGNKTNIQRMLSNLVDNAFKYTPAPGSVCVDLKRHDDCIRIAISDTGIGVPKQDQNRVFERFFRCDQSRSEPGCGLGLSFARAVTRAHGGDISLDSVLSESTTVTISVPALTSV